MTLVFGYVRASTIEEVKQGSNETQKNVITQFASARGSEVEMFEDKAKSGKNTQRPEFERMMKSLDKKPSLVIVSKIDRFARSLSDLLKTLEFLEQNGVGFVSVNDSGIDTTTQNGRILLRILVAFPEFERSIINMRTKMRREQAMSRGVKFERPALKIRYGTFMTERRFWRCERKDCRHGQLPRSLTAQLHLSSKCFKIARATASSIRSPIRNSP